jgi:hypothetical protein
MLLHRRSELCSEGELVCTHSILTSCVTLTRVAAMLSMIHSGRRSGPKKTSSAPVAGSRRWTPRSGSSLRLALATGHGRDACLGTSRDCTFTNIAFEPEKPLCCGSNLHVNKPVYTWRWHSDRKFAIIMGGLYIIRYLPSPGTMPTS